MAHFAKLDDNNLVIDIMVISDDQIMDENGVESEKIGIDRCKEIAGSNTNWKQCSFNSNMRGRYPGINSTYYIEEYDVFTTAKVHDSWIWNNLEGDWNAPKPKPDDTETGGYVWNESIVDWEFRENPPELIFPERPTPPDDKHTYLLDFSTGEPVWKLVEIPPSSEETI